MAKTKRKRRDWFENPPTAKQLKEWKLHREAVAIRAAETTRMMRVHNAFVRPCDDETMWVPAPPGDWKIIIDDLVRVSPHNWSQSERAWWDENHKEFAWRYEQTLSILAPKKFDHCI